jgi:hypothetical protein
MKVTDCSNHEDEDFLGPGEDLSTLERDGRMPAGSAYVDYIEVSDDGKADMTDGPCYLYYPGQTLREWCESNGLPVPCVPLPQEAWDEAEEFLTEGTETF